MRFSLILFLALLLASNLQAQVEISSSGRTTTFNHSNGMSSFNVEMRGRIELTDDDKDIKSISADGYLEINKTVFGSKRTLVITPQGNSIKREYYEGRTALPFEPEGRKWLSEVLPEIVRSSTLGAQSRVNRFYKQGGVSAVLSEIDKLESDYVKAHYGNLLMKLSVSPKDYVTIVTKVSGTIDSDHYITEFLKNNLTSFLQTKEASDAVFAATGKIESDYYKAEVIKEALKSQSASPEAVRYILAAAGQMDSDHYKTEVLTTLLKQSNLTDAIISEMINASKSIDSDHYKTVVLKSALAKKGLSATSYQRVLEAVKDVDSDHYKTEILTELLSNNLSSEQIFTLVDLSASIESDHYLTIVFTTVLKKQTLSDDSFKRLIDRASQVDSDHYASTILKAALDLPNLNNAKVSSILAASGNIESDHYITEVLVEAAPTVKSGDAALKEAYRSAAHRIGSETYYGRALKAIE